MENLSSRLNLARRKYPSTTKLIRCQSYTPEYGGNYDLNRQSSRQSSTRLKQRTGSAVLSNLTRGTTPRISELIDKDNDENEDDVMCSIRPTDYPQYVLINSFIPPRETAKLWDLIARFIERRLENGKGVILPGLGILTLSSKKFQLSQDLIEHSLKPVFIVSGKFALFHRLPHSSLRTSSDIPNVPLNFITLARILAIERDRVEMAFSEAIEKINGMLRAGRRVVLPFRGIGQIIFCLESVKMNFTSEFLARNQSTKIIRVTDKSRFRCSH